MEVEDYGFLIREKHMLDWITPQFYCDIWLLYYNNCIVLHICGITCVEAVVLER
jgi:hypothetical protein